MSDIGRPMPAAASKSRRLVIFAKEPVPGRVKTRLVPALSPERAAACHKAFVEDTARRMSEAFGRVAGPTHADVAIAVEPFAACPELRRIAERYGLDVLDQGPGDLGERMERVFRGSAGDGGSCVLLGADTPDLPVRYVESGFRHVENGRVALGPSGDGGYYLIGAANLVPAMFRLRAAWGGPDVLAETKTRLKAAGTAFELLPEWNDVDVYEDLLELAKRLAVDRGGDASETATLLREVVR
jgi:rSAM/selenodomain-associated transferase 1